MQFSFTEEQDLIRDTARTFCAEHGAQERLRRVIGMPRGYDEATWCAIAGEMGWCGIALPDEYGGSGLGAVELSILQEQMGRVLLPSPFFATVALAAPAILLAGKPAQRTKWLPGIAAGSARATLVCSDTNGTPGVDGIGPRLTRTARTLTLSGEAGFVIHADSADLLVVAARAPGSRGADGVSLVVLTPGTTGVAIEPLTMLDLTRPMSRVRFDRVEVPAQAVLGDVEAAGGALAQVLARARIALAAEQLGGAEAALEITTEYVKTRMQFGRAIGSFQAIKHRLADMMIATEAARSAAYYAACVVDELPAELEEAAAIAKSCCSDAYTKCAGNMIQLHGGVGFTWEHVAHLYFKRARASATLLGAPAWQRERLARIIGLGEQEVVS
jgi:alkylation response protein AidB-like acyl-CoA dehydrogenase